MIEIKLEEASSLSMEMKIDGDVKGDTQLRFTVLDEGLRYSFESKATSDGVYEIAFPVMEGKIAAGEYQAQVEIMVDGKYFVPLQETVKFTKMVKPTVKLAEQMKKSEAQPAVQVRVGTVAAVAPLKQITDVRGLVATMSGDEVNTEFALRALNGLALNESVILEGFKIAPKKALTEAEAIAALRLIKDNGTDLNTKESLWEGIKALSPKAASELRDVLAEKGISARVLKAFGF
jgi:hypothetical protein